MRGREGKKERGRKEREREGRREGERREKEREGGREGDNGTSLIQRQSTQIQYKRLHNRSASWVRITPRAVVFFH